MAYSSVRVQFEIGHEASVRTKKTPEGFTHDWEVFVRGADNTDIQCFVDKVVFHLHETFQKPRRVIKDPPYVVKESGYAGFVLPIDVYLKNKEEPKKISFQYDLQLQNSGPPISRVLREPRVFQNPSEDFRRKLIRGGGVGVDTPSDIQPDDSKSASAGSLVKKITESPIKKYKPGSSPNNTFSELFGTPIRRVAPENKKVADVVKKVPEVDASKDKKKSSKHSPHKDDKELPKERDKYSDKDRSKERDKTKDKQQKRPPSPVILKPKEEHRKQHEEKEKKKDDHDEKKKRKEEKDKKDKYKDIKETEKQSEKDLKKEKKDSKEEFNLKKINSSKPDIKVSSDKLNNEIEKDKERPEKEKHKHRHKKKEKEKNRDKEKHRKDKDKSEKDYKEKDKDKDRDKSNKKKQEDGKEKEEKRKKSRSPSPVPEKPKKGPLNALLDELGSSDSASQLSDDEEDSIPSFKSLPKTTAKNVPDIKSQPVVNPTYKSTNLSSSNEIKEPEKKAEETPTKNKKDKSPGKKNKKSDKDSEKKKSKEDYRNRSSSEREKEEEDLEKMKKERERLEAEREQAIKERELAALKEREREQAMKEAEKALKNSKKDKDSVRKRKRDKSIEPPPKVKKESENSITASQSIGAVESSDASDEIRKVDKFTKEYVAQLRDLQHRIMTIEDNAELQKVVQVIAETGQYEITKKTFDFDLCALDCDTVRRLQEFFTT